MIAPKPVTINATVPGSGAVPACPLITLPPFVQQLCPTHAKPMSKLCPFLIPLRGLLPPLIPDKRISTEPFFRVFVVQLRNRV